MVFVENINIFIGLYLDAYDKSSEDLSPESSTVTLKNTGTAFLWIQGNSRNFQLEFISICFFLA
jgi:hypothetical protein